MRWDGEYRGVVGFWWADLSEEEEDSPHASVRLLEKRGPALGFPHSSGMNASKHGHLRELRTQMGARPLRTLCAFCQRRSPGLPSGDDKTGDDRW